MFCYFIFNITLGTLIRHNYNKNKMPSNMSHLLQLQKIIIYERHENILNQIIMTLMVKEK